MFAAHYKLDNLVVMIDWNGLQIDGPVAEIMNPTPHDKKLEAFGFHVIVADGHDFDEIERAFEKAKTVKGKGVSFMENQVEWHGVAPNDAQHEQAVLEIKAKAKL